MAGLIWIFAASPCFPTNETRPQLLTAEQTAARVVERAAALERAGERNSQRIYRREDGTIRMLRLHEMQLSDREFQSLATMRELEVIDFSKTNIKNRHLSHYVHMPNIINLRLSWTAITDAGLKHLRRYPSLRSLCMGRVNVTRQAVDDLKSTHQATFERERPLAIGYSRPKKMEPGVDGANP